MFYNPYLWLHNIGKYPLGPNEIEITNTQSNKDPQLVQCGNDTVKITSINYGNSPNQEKSEDNYCFAPAWYISKYNCGIADVLETL